MIYILIIGFFLISLIIYAILVTRKTLHLYYIIPVSITAIFGLYYFFHDLLGYPTQLVSDKQFTFISYYYNDENIFIWVILENEDRPIAYVHSYSDELLKQVEKAQELVNQGEYVEGSFATDVEEGDDSLSDISGSNGLGTEKSAGGTFEFYNIDKSSHLPSKN